MSTPKRQTELRLFTLTQLIIHLEKLHTSYSLLLIEYGRENEYCLAV